MMKILAIETSCDETAVAIVENGQKVICSSLATSLTIHQKTGGIVPEIAAREQSKAMIPVLNTILSNNKSLQNLDAIAVTIGPGLIGSLIVGIETAKTLSYILNLPLIPVNHLMGHLYSAFLTNNSIPFPSIVLIVSGGHTELIYYKDHNKYKMLGRTRDDAAGEAFDKVAKLLKLPYPGGPSISKIAQKGNSSGPRFPRPMLENKSYEFSFSGLKTAVYYHLRNNPNPSIQEKANIAQSFQQAVVDVLSTKTIQAFRDFNAASILVTGGVAANSALRKTLTAEKINVPVFYPSIEFCTDNATMIGCAAYYLNQPINWKQASAKPSLKL